LAAVVLAAGSFQGAVVQVSAQTVETVAASEADVFEESASARLIQEGEYPQQSAEVSFYSDAAWEAAKQALADGMRDVSSAINLTEYKIGRYQIVSL
jgi:hypothetical protein